MSLLAAIAQVGTGGAPAAGSGSPVSAVPLVTGGAPTGAGAGSTTPPTPEIMWAALLPVIVLALGAILLLTISSFMQKRAPRGFYTIYTVVTALLAMLAAVPLWAQVQGWDHIWWKIDFHGLWWQQAQTVPGPFSTAGGAVGVDGFSIFLTVLIAASVLLGALLLDDYLRREGLEGPELYVLMLLSATGGVIMAMANDLVVLFLGIETLSIAVYVLAASHRKRAQSQEAGFKYFVLGGFSSAFLLYGIAMIYGATASTNLIEIKNFLSQVIPTHNALLMMGFAFMLVGLGFKVAAVPFHAWSPDVYDGSPTPVVAYMAAGVKAAGFAALVRVFVLGFSQYGLDWQPIIYTLAILSLVVGAVLAMVQTNVKRTLAYSSIAHAGFILVAVEVAATTPIGVSALLFYLFVYTFMVAGSFGVLTLGGGRGDGHQTLADYRGFGRTNPLLAGTFVVFLLAQAGIPFTAGFVAKFYAIAAAVDGGSWPLAIVAMLSAVVAAYLYLRIIVAMYMTEGDAGGVDTPPTRGERVRIPAAAGIALALCVLVTIGAGLFPGPLTDVADDSTAAIVEPPSPVPTTSVSIPVALTPAPNDSTGPAGN